MSRRLAMEAQSPECRLSHLGQTSLWPSCHWPAVTRVTGTQGGSCLAEGSGRGVEVGERGSMLVSTANWKVLSAG